MTIVHRRWPRRVALLLVCSALVTGWLAVRGLAARAQLEAARSSLETARAAVLEQRIGEARAAIVTAAEHTARARSLTHDPVWWVGAAVPYAGATFDTVRAMTAGADDVAQSVLPPALSAAEVLDAGELRRPDGSIDLERIGDAAPYVRAGSRALTAVQARLREPQAAVPTLVMDARKDLSEQVDELARLLDSAGQALALAPPLLGEDGPRRYFVLVQQTAESRGTGGLPGGFAVLETTGGRVTVVDQGSNAELLPGRVPVPPGVPSDYVQLYEPQGAFELWQNVNLSADLPTVAKVVSARWRAQGGAALDGVVALDASALAAILQGSEPLQIGEERVKADQLEHFLAIEQYRSYRPNTRQDERKDQLADAAAVAARRLATGEGDSRALLRGLVTAVRSGHLRLASEDPVLKPLLTAAGIDGALPTGEAPLAYPVVYNASGGKLDHFLQRSVRFTAGPCVDDRRQSTVAVSLRNRAPEDGLPPYVLVRDVAGRLTQSTQSAVVLHVYTTPGSELRGATLDGATLGTVAGAGAGKPYLTAAQEGGLRLWYLYLELPREQTRTLVLDLDEPVVRGAARVPEQPLSRPLQYRVDVPDCS